LAYTVKTVPNFETASANKTAPDPENHSHFSKHAILRMSGNGILKNAVYNIPGFSAVVKRSSRLLRLDFSMRHYGGIRVVMPTVHVVFLIERALTKTQVSERRWTKR
jgi:hypothetical protein